MSSKVVFWLIFKCIYLFIFSFLSLGTTPSNSQEPYVMLGIKSELATYCSAKGILIYGMTRQCQVGMSGGISGGRLVFGSRWTEVKDAQSHTDNFQLWKVFNYMMVQTHAQ